MVCFPLLGTVAAPAMSGKSLAAGSVSSTTPSFARRPSVRRRLKVTFNRKCVARSSFCRIVCFVVRTRGPFLVGMEGDGPRVEHSGEFVLQNRSFAVVVGRWVIKVPGPGAER